MVAKSQLTQIASKPSAENCACCVCSAHPCLRVCISHVCGHCQPFMITCWNPVPCLIWGVRYICFDNCLICILWLPQVANSFLPKFYLLLQPCERSSCSAKLPWDYGELCNTVTHGASLCRWWHTTWARGPARCHLQDSEKEIGHRSQLLLF